MSKFFQVGNVLAFLGGVYQSNFTYKKLREKGDMGLGTFTNVDGEMVGVDGVFYHIDGDGNASIAKPYSCTPFAVVSKFIKTKPIRLKNLQSANQLNKILSNNLISENIFYMIRIDGMFNKISLRSETNPDNTSLPLSSLLPKIQKSFTLENISGTIIASCCPAYAAGFTIPGFHYHFIDKDKKTGGHVFDLDVKDAEAYINPLREFEMHLQDSQELDSAELEKDPAKSLAKIE